MNILYIIRIATESIYREDWKHFVVSPWCRGMRVVGGQAVLEVGIVPALVGTAGVQKVPRQLVS